MHWALEDLASMFFFWKSFLDLLRHLSIGFYNCR